MIKRYILHIEAHKRRLPRISFKRAPKHGDRVVDGGIPGTLKLCPTCQEGFLHDPDPLPRPKRFRPKPPPRLTILERVVADLARNLTERTIQPARPVRSYHTPRPAMDFNRPKHVELTSEETQPETPELELTVVDSSEHVEIKDAAEVEHVELKTSEHVEIKSEEESPEELELGYELGTHKYEIGEVVWTHKAEYVVGKQTKKKLYLVRRDVWDEREKKKSEHVEIESKDEGSGEVVVLNFE